MKIKINTNISNEFKETSITINAPELTDDLQMLINHISSLESTPNQIVANKNNEIHFVDLQNIICFFSKDKYVYARTKDDIYKVRNKLYELEETFCQKDFIRISNSCIININQIEYFDTSIIGTILVKMKDNTQETVSKRNVSQIMKLLKQRGNLKWKLFL